MNRKWIVLLIACLCLLAACKSMENGIGGPPETPPEEEEAVKALYQFEPLYSAERQYFAKDPPDLELARYTYCLEGVSVTNMEALSPEAAAAAEQNVEAFNARMSGLLEDLVEHGQVMGSDAISLYLYEEEGRDSDISAFYDETSSSCCQIGDIISVRFDYGSYTGGAHPNYYTASYLFDLRTGQFINPIQLAEDQEGFRAGVAELLVKKADAIKENREAYWPEYEETISHWNEGAVLFDATGMLVIYSPYDLGPYAMGEVELRLSYEELSELLGEDGLEHLGV